MNLPASIAIGALSAYGVYRIACDIGIYLRHRRWNATTVSLLAELDEHRMRFISGILASVRPAVPQTWDAMVANETDELVDVECDCDAHREHRKGLN
jgi:hypothetical protein